LPSYRFGRRISRAVGVRQIEYLRVREIVVMGMDETIQMLAKVRQSIDTWAPRRTTRPDVLIADLNDSYVASNQNRGMDELFAYDDVGSPSLTLIVPIDVEFDLQRVMKNLRTELHLLRPGPTDEIGNAGIVWSHGRYDFVYDSDSASLRISHKYSHKRVDTKSVSSIARQMINYAINYLEEVKTSANKGADALGTDDIRLPRESKA
jgi:hypothetical protein